MYDMLERGGPYLIALVLAFIPLRALAIVQTPEATPVNSVIADYPGVPMPWECPRATRTYDEIRRIVVGSSAGQAWATATILPQLERDLDAINGVIARGITIKSADQRAILAVLRAYYACKHARDVFGRYSVATDRFVGDEEDLYPPEEFDTQFLLTLLLEAEKRDIEDWEAGLVLEAWNIGPLLAGEYISPNRIEGYILLDQLTRIPGDQRPTTQLSIVAFVAFQREASGKWKLDSLNPVCLPNAQRNACE